MAIDLVVHYIISDEDESDKMHISYAACKSFIRNASLEQQEKACLFMKRIVKNSLNGITMKDGEAQRA